MHYAWVSCLRTDINLTYWEQFLMPQSQIWTSCSLTHVNNKNSIQFPKKGACVLTVSQHTEIFVFQFAIRSNQKCSKVIGIFRHFRQHLEVFGKSKEIFGIGWDVFGNHFQDKTKLSHIWIRKSWQVYKTYFKSYKILAVGSTKLKAKLQEEAWGRELEAHVSRSI